MSIQFGGSTIYKPGAYSQISVNQQAVINHGTSRVLAVVGPFDTSATYKGDGIVRFYNDPNQAQTDLKTGDTLTAMQLAWSADAADSTGQVGPSADVIAVVEVIGTGAAGAVQATDWQTALDKLRNQNIDAIIPVSGDSAVHGQVKSHVDTMCNTANRRERRAFCGGLAGETVTAGQTACTTLTDAKVCRIVGGVKRYVNGTLTTMPGYLAAALVAGLWAGNDPSDPITFDKINVAGLELNLLPSEIDTLLQAGAVIFEPVLAGGFRVIQGLTTAITELSVDSVVTALTVEVRRMMEDRYVGTRGDNKALAAMKADVVALLNNAKNQRNWLVDNLDSSGAVVSPAFTDPVITRSGTTFTINFGGNVVQPTNFVLITPQFRLS